MSTSSEEFRKFVNRLLYEDTSKLNFQQNMKISSKIKRPLLKFIMNKFCNFITSIQWATSKEPILIRNVKGFNPLSNFNTNKFYHDDISNFINSNHL